MENGLTVPVGEQLLWRGQPDPARVRRQVIRATLGSMLYTLGSLAVFLCVVAFMGPGWEVLWFIPPLAGFLAIFWLIPTVWQTWRAYRRTIAERYVLTEQRLLIGGQGKPIDLRLANVTGLALESEGDGYGSLVFAPPMGGGPERLMRWAARFVPQVRQQTRLLTSIPNAGHVVKLIERARAETPAGGTVAGWMEAESGGLPPQAPVARQPLMTAMSAVPLWFGGAFLAMGLLFLIVMVAARGTAPIWLPALIPSGFAIIGAAMVLARFRHLRARSRLLSHGVTITGKVVDVAGTGVQENDVEQWVVRYAFSLMGREHHGQSRLMSWADAARYVAGDPIRITYDPANPDQSMPTETGQA